MKILRTILLLLGPTLYAAEPSPRELHSFASQTLTSTYFSEGIAVGDLNGDGLNDIVYGPYWFVGPDFKTKHELYPAVPQPMEKYADHFFAWVYDFDRDGANDVFTVGFPGPQLTSIAIPALRLVRTTG